MKFKVQIYFQKQLFWNFERENDANNKMLPAA